MKAWVWLVAGAIVVQGGSFAADKKGKDKAAATAAPVVRLSPGEEAVKKAQERLAAGQLEGATRLLRAAIETDGMTGEPFFLLAQLIESTIEWEKAIEVYGTAAEKLSGTAKGEALARLSLLQDLNNIADAAATADAAAIADPEGGWTAIALARQRVRQKRADEALALAQKAVAVANAPAAQAVLGLAQEARGDLVASEAAYRAALAAEPGNIAANLGIARVLRVTNRAAEAAPLLKALMDKAPWMTDVYTESVRVKLQLGLFVEALEDATIANSLVPENNPVAQAAAAQLLDDVRIARALEDVQQGRANLAVDDLKLLCTEKPKLVPARVALAKALVANRQLDLAQAELNKAIELDANSAEAHFQMATILHEAMKNPTAALPAYEKAARLAPNEARYRIPFGNLLAAQGQGARAVEELTAAVQGAGASNAEAWIYLGGAYLASSRYDDVVTAIDKALSLLPETDATKPYRGLACAYMTWAYLNKKDRDNVLKFGGMARALGYEEPQLMQRVRDIEQGKPFAGAAKPVAAPAKTRPRPRR